jgi:hypothetical protein
VQQNPKGNPNPNPLKLLNAGFIKIYVQLAADKRVNLAPISHYNIAKTSRAAHCIKGGHREGTASSAEPKTITKKDKQVKQIKIYFFAAAFKKTIRAEQEAQEEESLSAVLKCTTGIIPS